MRQAAALATVRPFRALLFDPERVRLDDVVAPPYDVISPHGRAVLAERSPYNVVRLILPEPGAESDVASRVAAWRHDGVLRLDTAPCYYRVEQAFTTTSGDHATRTGMISLVRVVPYQQRIVLPHEATRRVPRQGRLALLDATRMQFSAVFALYHDQDGVVDETLAAAAEPEALIDVSDEAGTRHRLWRVAAGADSVAAVLTGSRLLIADGHHRYQTALDYSLKRPGDEAAAWTMMYLARAEQPGVEIQPTHRVVTDVPGNLAQRLAGRGVASVVVDDPQATLRRVDAAAAFVVVEYGQPPRLVTSDAAETDAAFLQRIVFAPLLGLDDATLAETERVAYVHDAAQATSMVNDTTTAFLVRPPSIDVIEREALAGRVLPPKSTYFYPKTVDGFGFYSLDD